jgi:hypothetical protein
MKVVKEARYNAVHWISHEGDDIIIFREHGAKSWEWSMPTLKSVKSVITKLSIIHLLTNWELE